ncbi:hypothetical protein PAMC26510_36215 [Caballeronia sordidicola]|uniref:Uncharacterized protein n=1 Tax=Caballeronia sordidicola TaxID=196367 RepID=A0A242M4D7_CABSO|nr:hypothetical protein PAMC26510_36215 [Caballeronia sordidicola]
MAQFECWETPELLPDQSSPLENQLNLTDKLLTTILDREG